MALLARATTRSDVARVHASRSPAVPQQRDRPQLDARRQCRIAVGGDRRSSRPRHDLVRRLVARLVDRRRGRLARAVAGTAVACAAAPDRRGPGDRDVDARARWPRGASRVRVLRRPSERRRVRDGHRRDREPQPGAVRGRRSRSVPTTPKVSRSSSASGCTTARQSRWTDASRCCCRVLLRRSRRRRSTTATARRSSSPTARAAGDDPVADCATKRAWRRPRSSIRCPTRRRCESALPMVPAAHPPPRRRVERALDVPDRDPVGRTGGPRVGGAESRRHAARVPDPACRKRSTPTAGFLLALHDGPDITPGPSTNHRFWFRDAAFLLGALGRYGYSSQVAEVLRSYPGRQRGDGFFFSQPREWDSNGCALWSIAEHWRLGRDRDSLDRCSARSPRARTGSNASGQPARPESGLCPQASRPSISGRSTTSTGTTSGARRAARAPSCWQRWISPVPPRWCREQADCRSGQTRSQSRPR